MGKAHFSKYPNDNGQALSLAGAHVIPVANLHSGRSANGKVEGSPACVSFQVTAVVEPNGDAPLLKIREASVQGQWKTDLEHKSDWATCTLSLTRDHWAIVWTFDRYLVDDAYLRWDGTQNVMTQVLTGRAFQGTRSIDGNNPIRFDFATDSHEEDDA